jgi:acyl-[acyl-carrier-protein]-phospholipid O-acyltransferase/long-chain-fatty-acid--[acyl-carrier-protein] ligase
VLLTTQKDADRGAMQRQAKASGAAELAVPAVVQVVDKVPLLGSGKTDYVAATALARDIAGAPAQEPPAADAAAQDAPAQEVA